MQNDINIDHSFWQNTHLRNCFQLTAGQTSFLFGKVGSCEDNPLYDVFTVRQHLMFFASLRGVSEQSSSSRVMEVLTALGRWDPFFGKLPPEVNVLKLLMVNEKKQVYNIHQLWDKKPKSQYFFKINGMSWPLGLVWSRLVRYPREGGGSVYDPFGWTETTAMGCHSLTRRNSGGFLRWTNKWHGSFFQTAAVGTIASDQGGRTDSFWGGWGNCK